MAVVGWLGVWQTYKSSPTNTEYWRSGSGFGLGLIASMRLWSLSCSKSSLAYVRLKWCDIACFHTHEVYANYPQTFLQIWQHWHFHLNFLCGWHRTCEHTVEKELLVKWISHNERFTKIHALDLMTFIQVIIIFCFQGGQTLLGIRVWQSKQRVAFWGRRHQQKNTQPIKRVVASKLGYKNEMLRISTTQYKQTCAQLSCVGSLCNHLSFKALASVGKSTVVGETENKY